MVDVSTISVSATAVGTANSVTRNCAIRDATSTVSAKTELVFASLDGTESTAPLKDVLEGKRFNLLR
jgi:hypothetical protein